ncbi:hypothetical protein BJP36_43070 [Moorena producens JHB]|uniref:Uncharacterized protein n=1 Tax=Moorena producens (strain JHB) TaxID=1454205 RepID=A0A9Q9ST28_MOOP1|nr:hypothetical protein [Moorena producens]WAN69142.1 hypothetical protein BJP36_43070 [Moorena producens JHB]
MAQTDSPSLLIPLLGTAHPRINDLVDVVDVGWAVAQTDSPSLLIPLLGTAHPTVNDWVHVSSCQVGSGSDQFTKLANPVARHCPPYG